MDTPNTCVATYKTHHAADDAVKQLQKSGFDMKKISVVGNDYHTDEHVVGYYNTGDRMKAWGKIGAFWGGLWGILVGAAFFVIPGIGPLVIAGPLTAAIVGGLEGAAVMGGLSALGGGLAGMGIPKDSIVRYENSLSAGSFLVLYNDVENKVAEASKVLMENTEHDSVETHTTN
ncbi:general stress protein [uncultured Endozoicomonas sp.]|uniref:general stress protein n=1 Tax=uncultured Endozoicomonas sp. TaxID=432652 RepID=UPI0026101B1A|nr:general stress protein [uncultured Endozoicomonas sp.]